jgi:hypothetical protein
VLLRRRLSLLLATAMMLVMMLAAAGPAFAKDKCSTLLCEFIDLGFSTADPELLPQGHHRSLDLPSPVQGI